MCDNDNVIRQYRPPRDAMTKKTESDSVSNYNQLEATTPLVQANERKNVRTQNKLINYINKNARMTANEYIVRLWNIDIDSLFVSIFRFIGRARARKKQRKRDIELVLCLQ